MLFIFNQLPICDDDAFNSETSYLESSPKDAKEEVVNTSTFESFSSSIQEDDKYSKVDEQIKKNQDSTQDVVFEMSCTNSDILTKNSSSEEIKYAEIDKKSLRVENKEVFKDVALLYAVVDKSKKKTKTTFNQIFPANLDLPGGDTLGPVSESAIENKTISIISGESTPGDSQTNDAINLDESLASYAEITSFNASASFSAEISGK